MLLTLFSSCMCQFDLLCFGSLYGVVHFKWRKGGVLCLLPSAFVFTFREL